MPDIPHLRIPLALNPGGSLVALEQDGIDDVAQCVQVLVSTTIGSRVEEPEFGVPELPFSDVDMAQLAAAVDRWEPRAQVDFESLVGVDVNGSVDDLVTQVVARVGVAQ